MLVVTLATATTAFGQDATSVRNVIGPVAQPVVASTSTIGLVNTGTKDQSRPRSSSAPAEVPQSAVKSNLSVSDTSSSSALATDRLVVSQTALVEKKEQQPPRKESNTTISKPTQATGDDQNFLNLALDGFEMVMRKFFGWNK